MHRSSPASKGAAENLSSHAFDCLEFPWGPEKIDQVLGVGRDPDFSPLAGKLAEFQTVSGRHAEIYRENGFLFLRRIRKSKNWTRVNEKAISAAAPFRLADGQVIEFSRCLKATVRLRRG
jgi:pSer/pThr/pTyr-binding forkhead associated (FHA) protein